LASNFRIISYNFDDSLFLRLTGDFDGDSAHELINALKEHVVGFSEIFIDTNELNKVNAFEKDIFIKNLVGIKKQVKNLIFVGANKYKLTQD